MTEETFSIG